MCFMLNDSAKEKQREYKRRWVEKNRERINAYDREWRKKNPSKVKEYYAKWKEKKRGEESGSEN